MCGTASALPELWVRYPIPAPDSILGPTTQNAHEKLLAVEKKTPEGSARTHHLAVGLVIDVYVARTQIPMA